MNDRLAQIPKLFPTQNHENKLICINGIGGSKEFMPLIVDHVPDVQLMQNGQCFSLYYYEKTNPKNVDLFNNKNAEEEYIRKDAITDFILKECHQLYNSNIKKEDIFYYVYGFLHSKDYSTKFSNDLKKMLARIPLVESEEDFWTFSNAGRKLSEIHLNYEKIESYPDVIVEGLEYNNFDVKKMSFIKKIDKSTIIYNSSITISNIPLKAYQYVVNGKSAIEWIMDR